MVEVSTDYRLSEYTERVDRYWNEIDKIVKNRDLEKIDTLRMNISLLKQYSERIKMMQHE